VSDSISYERVCGVDVAKDSLELHLILGEKIVRNDLPNNPKGHAEVVRLLQKHQVQMTTLEATGGLQRPLAVALVEAGCSLAVVNPARVRYYALSEGIIAKNDKIDARVIASFTQKIKPKPTALRSQQQEHLARLVARKSQLIRAKVAEENRLQQEADADALKSIIKHLRFLTREIAAMDKLLEREVQDDPELLAKVQTADALSGVGRASAIALVVSMPELGRLTGRQAGRLAGLAPMDCDSGTIRKERHIHGGRSAIRTTLYMCVLSAIRYEPKIRRMYQRLLEAGKSKMKALTACMRKMLVILNARVRDAVAGLAQPEPVNA
jgi:transposase